MGISESQTKFLKRFSCFLLPVLFSFFFLNSVATFSTWFSFFSLILGHRVSRGKTEPDFFEGRTHTAREFLRYGGTSFLPVPPMDYEPVEILTAHSCSSGLIGLILSALERVVSLLFFLFLRFNDTTAIDVPTRDFEIFFHWKERERDLLRGSTKFHRIFQKKKRKKKRKFSRMKTDEATFARG